MPYGIMAKGPLCHALLAMQEAVEFTISVCRYSYGLTKTEISINIILSSLLGR